MGSVGTGDCTADTCPVPNGFFWVAPPLAGSVVMMVAFGLLIPINFVLGVRYKTPLYSATMIAGLAFEIMGYVGRVMQRDNLAGRTPFVLFLLGTIMAPTFISAAIYAVLPHIMLIYGKSVSVRLRPAFIGPVFIAFNVFALVFQGAGAAFAAGGPNKAEISQGLNLLVGGLAIQTASLVLFFIILYWFFRKITTNQERLLDHTYSHIFLTSRFKIFLLSTQLATFFLLVRTIFRLVQLENGLDSVLAQSQTLTLVLDGALVLVAAVMLTILSPGVAFGPAWAVTSPYTSSLSPSHRFFGPPRDDLGPYAFRPAVTDDVFTYESPTYEVKPPRRPEPMPAYDPVPPPAPAPAPDRRSLRQHHQKREAVVPPPPPRRSNPTYRSSGVVIPPPVRVTGHARSPSYEGQRSAGSPPGNGVGGGMGTVRFNNDYEYHGLRQLPSPTTPAIGTATTATFSTGGGGSVVSTVVSPITPAVSASDVSSPLRGLHAKRISERMDVVDPDALW